MSNSCPKMSLTQQVPRHTHRQWTANPLIIPLSSFFIRRTKPLRGCEVDQLRYSFLMLRRASLLSAFLGVNSVFSHFLGDFSNRRLLLQLIQHALRCHGLRLDSRDMLMLLKFSLGFLEGLFLLVGYLLQVFQLSFFKRPDDIGFEKYV